MQLVLHAPFGSRVNRAWGLALRKKFCQGFNLELQAAATEEGIILSLGSQHSFPLEEVFRYLHPNTVRDTLEQALLQSPIFETRWRWSTTLALAVPRNRGGARVPNQLQRMYAEDLLQAVFPDAAACQDNLPGAREIPEHPLVRQALRDALEEAVDLHGLEAQLRRLYAGEIATIARDTPEPSVLSHELLNSAVYTFLDDAPLEERRTRAVYTRRATELRSADDLGALDPAAIQRVREEAWPVANTPDEMYDALMVAGYIKQAELAPHWPGLLDSLGERAIRRGEAWFALERADDEPLELIASRLEALGPVTERQIDVPDAAVALQALETQGRILRGRFTPGIAELEWCDRRLLARIHRYTLNRLRAEIEPVSAADFLRFLFHWQHVAGEDQVQGVEGLAAVIEQLEGSELAGAGVATADSFAGLRALLAPQEKRGTLVETAGRWALLSAERTDDVEAVARTLLKRYGVVFRGVLQRESQLPPWRDLVRVYRRLEARGEIRGGRFVTGFGGEQFAAADAVGRLRAVRKTEKADELIVLSAVDPLNLVGILTPEDRVPAMYRNRVLYRDGLPIAAVEGGQLRRLTQSDMSDDKLRTLLARRSLRHPLRPHLRTPTAREAAILAHKKPLSESEHAASLRARH